LEFVTFHGYIIGMSTSGPVGTWKTGSSTFGILEHATYLSSPTFRTYWHPYCCKILFRNFPMGYTLEPSVTDLAAVCM